MTLGELFKLNAERSSVLVCPDREHGCKGRGKNSIIIIVESYDWN